MCTMSTQWDRAETALGRDADEWERLKNRWYEVSSQYHQRVISERELTQRLSVVLNLQLDLLRKLGTTHDDGGQSAPFQPMTHSDRTAWS